MITRRFATWLLLGSFLILAATAPVPVAAWDPWGNNPRLIQNVNSWWAPDNWWNYDFDDPPDPPQEGTDETVDWPVTLVYWRNADVVGVKNLYWGNAYLDAVMWNKVNDGAGWEWHGDKGTKNTLWYHMRPYAPLDDDGYYRLEHQDGIVNHYVVGTSHEDGYGWSGYSESTEYYLGLYLEDRGYFVEWDYYNLGNYEEYRWEYGQDIAHVWENGGTATRIRI